ncbi:hypothetical protein MIZ03_2807 [Rhodoferax lithotrophicus]|uniref:Uncharacterized protein n=1 Tax=Rhodoferax lithotrophicus TaxID=2798804 RepID=A0ABN6DAN4_9BURK|nr:hypothetical protein MIZ03_2807 [Rhodoferax sp. MIZ03]
MFGFENSNKLNDAIKSPAPQHPVLGSKFNHPPNIPRSKTW